MSTPMIGPLVASNPDWKRQPANAACACFFCGREIKARPGETLLWLRLTGDDHATWEQSIAETLVGVGRDCAKKHPELREYIGTGAASDRHGNWISK